MRREGFEPSKIKTRNFIYYPFRIFAARFPIAEGIGFEPMGRSSRPLVFKTSAIIHSANPPLLGIQSCQITSFQIYKIYFKKQMFYHHFSYLFVVGNISQVGIK